jgi:RNA-directed DNA polymerase
MSAGGWPGWADYFRFGMSKASFSFLRAYTRARVVSWVRGKHPRAKCSGPTALPPPVDGNVTMFNRAAVPVRRNPHSLGGFDREKESSLAARR